MSGIDCGSQCFLCDIPIRFDNYEGCSHGCKYCFVQRKVNISEINGKIGTLQLINFINGKRTKNTNWCDWDIPIHWGGMSDPFQPAEKKFRTTLKNLEILAKTQYPFIISTKGKLIADEEYLSLLEKCNCVIQISLVSPQFDKLELGAPTFNERLEIIKKLSKRAKRVNVRCQPYVIDCYEDIKKQIPLYKEAGVYGITFEAMKMFKKIPGMIKVGGDYVYPKRILKKHFEVLKELCHENGLKFYCGENRLRYMSDSLNCCGIEGLGMQGNNYNLNHFLYDKENFKPGKAMQKKGTATCFTAMTQNVQKSNALKRMSFKEALDLCTKDKNKLNVFLGD